MDELIGRGLGGPARVVGEGLQAKRQDEPPSEREIHLQSLGLEVHDVAVHAPSGVLLHLIGGVAPGEVDLERAAEDRVALPERGRVVEEADDPLLDEGVAVALGRRARVRGAETSDLEIAEQRA